MAQKSETTVQSTSPNAQLWYEHKGAGLLFATALHAGHDLRPELQSRMALDEVARLREEDPYTDEWAKLATNWLIPVRSRFEVDLNRDRDEAIYLLPQDAWDLKIWKTRPSEAMIERSLAEYDAFYQELEGFLKDMEQRHGRFVVYDLHSYNYRRGGPDAPPEDSSTHPDINIGTGTMDRERWGPVVDRFIHDLRDFNFLGRHLDVRENVVFMGRQFPGWIHRHFPESACVLAIEVKKFFMDEWSGSADPVKLKAVHDAIASTVPGVIEELEKL